MNHKIGQTALSWRGTPFRYRGFDRNGCDCAGLLVGILIEMKYSDAPAVKQYLDHRAGNFKYIDSEVLKSTVIDNSTKMSKIEDIKIGDILLFSIKRKEPNHLSIVSREKVLYMIHSYRSVACVVENIVDEYWLSKLFGIYRLDLTKKK